MNKLKQLKPISIAVCFFFSVSVCLPPRAFAHNEQWIAGGSNVAPGGSSNPTDPPQAGPIGDPEPGDCQAGDPVDIRTGEHLYSCVDLVIPGRGMDVEIKHTYRSGLEFNTQFGYGWFMSYYYRLRVLSNNDVLIINGENASTDVYAFQGGQYIPPRGRYETLVRESSGTWTLTKADASRYIFDTDGKLTRIEDRNANAITLTYDNQGLLPEFGKPSFGQSSSAGVLLRMDYRLTKITDTAGRDITFHYFNHGRLEKIRDYSGREVKFTYDPNTFDLLTVTKPATPQYPLGVTKTFVYKSGTHLLETVTDARVQQLIKNYYNSENRVFRQDHGSGSWLFQINGNQTETDLTDREGNVTKYNFDANGNMYRKREFTRGYRTGEPQFYETTLTYNSQDEVASVTFPKGNGIKYTYDENNSNPRARGNLLEIRRKSDMTLADNNTNDIVTTFTYEAQANQIKTMTDPRGHVTTFLYDYEFPSGHILHGTKANLVWIQYPAVLGGAPAQIFLPNQHGQVSLALDPNGILTRYNYYAATGYLHQIIRDVGGLSATTTFTYDAWGNIDLITDAENHTTDLDYNALGWLTREKNPLNFLTKYEYDQNGNVKKIERQANTAATQWQTTEFTYDVLNNLKTIKDPLLRVTTINYDNNENIRSITDANTNTTAYRFDERNLIFTVTDANAPSAGVTTYNYDINGNLAEIKDAKNQPTAYTYDLFDRQEFIAYADAKQTKFEYDKSSNLIKATRAFNTAAPKPVDYGYDALNRLTSKSYPLTPALNTAYQYDLGSRLNFVVNAGTQHAAGFFYDKLNNLWVEGQIYGPGQLLALTWYTHDKVGNRRTVTYPSGKLVEYTYDANDRMDLIKVNNTTVVDYDYDLLDRRDTKTYLLAPNPLITDYTFNIANELLELDNRITGATNPISKFHYTYDNVSNRQTLAKTLGTTVSNYTYNYNNIYELGSVTGAALESYQYDLVGNRSNAQGLVYVPNTVNQYTSVGPFVLQYDNSGNMTFDVINTYSYDEENRMSSAVRSQLSTVYQYDGLNRRVSKTVNGAATYFIYNGDEVIEERSASGALLADYVNGDGIDETISMSRGGNTYYYLYDGLGSVRELVSPSGMVIEQYDYDAYGNVFGTRAVGNPYYFTGRRLDAETGLYYYRARMYHPTIGRFMQRDPIDILGGINLYTYVLNNPTNYIDPSGLVLKKLITKFKNTDPRAKGAVSHLLTLGVEELSKKLPRGRARGAVKIVAGALSTASATFFGGVALSSFGIALTEPTGVSKPIAFLSGTFFTGVTTMEVINASRFLEEGFNELFNPKKEDDFCEEK